MASSLLSEIPFGSFLVYSPHGTTPVSVRSRHFCQGVKTGNTAALRSIVERLVRDFDSTGLSAVLGPDVTLVPAPRSGVLVAGGLWPSRLIADALVAARLGAAVLPALRRTEAVPKSAFQRRGERPDAVRHFETMSAEPALAGRRITIVDDVLTKGNTLLAATSRVAEAFPRATVSAFAVVRTMGLQPDVEALIAPCVGTIRLIGDEAFRSP